MVEALRKDHRCSKDRARKAAAACFIATGLGQYFLVKGLEQKFSFNKNSEMAECPLFFIFAGIKILWNKN